jgi:hypothetical protein
MIAVISVVVVLVACAGFVGYEVPKAAQSHASAASPQAPSTAGTASAPSEADMTTLNGVLESQAAALVRGDEAGWLAAVDPAKHAAVTQYKRIYHNMRAMHVALWSQSSTTGYNTMSAKDEDYDIDVSYCLVVKTCADTEETLHVSARMVKQKILIDSIDLPKADRYAEEPFPWEVATLSAVTGKRVIVAASSAWSSSLKRVLPIAERAAVAADKYAKWGLPSEYVIYLASASEGKKWFDAGLSNVDGVSYSIEPHDIEIVIMMPTAQETNYSGPGGLNAVIQHEMGHVATLQGEGFSGHDSFIEGIAEYCAYTGHTSWAQYRIQDVRAYIRTGKWSKTVYLTSQITAKDQLAASAAYGIGYLALRHIAEKYGTAKMMTFWGDVERQGLTLSTAAKQDLGKSWSSVNADSVAYIKQVTHT